VRQELHDHLVRINPDKKWDFITEQVRLASILGFGNIECIGQMEFFCCMIQSTG